MIWILTLSFLIMVSLVGCATEKKAEINLTWPFPPDPPRIKYVKSIGDAKEVLPPKGFFKKALSKLFGEEEAPHLVRPYGIVVTPKGKMLVSDPELQVVHLFDYGTKSYRQIFKIPGGILQSPIGVAVDPQENIYVADSELGRIFQFSPEGKYTKSWDFHFTRPSGIVIDPQRNILYVVDTGEHHVLAFNLKGEKLFDFGNRGNREGEFNFPTHIAVRPRTGDLFISDSMNFRIQQFSSEGRFIRQIGSLGSVLGNFSKLKGVSVDSRGIIYAVDGLYDTVEMFNSNGQFLMNFGKAGNREGEFWLPGGIAVLDDTIYVADSYNKRIQVFQLMDASNLNGASE